MNNELTARNIDNEITRYHGLIKNIAVPSVGLKGVGLFTYLKRHRVKTGPYPDVTLFEAANRIMTDLVILHGVKWLLSTNAFPFASYLVEYGNEAVNDHDIMATARGQSLVGEAFNVAPSFFQVKKRAMLQKLRASNNTADYKLIMANSDAVRRGYRPKPGLREYYLFVDIASGDSTMFTSPDMPCSEKT
jgi:hypothetical protein